MAKTWFLATAIFSGLGLLGKGSLIAKLGHVPKATGVVGVAVGLCVCLLWPLALRFSKVLGPIVLALLLAMFLVIYPRMDKVHQMGRGSDQAECVVLAANKMTHRAWPYVRADMSSKNAMSCGPGWVALQAPAIEVLGYRWDLVLCWAISVGVLVLRLGWKKTSAILTLIGICAITWLAAANGTDFLTFGIVILAFGVAVGASRMRQSWIYWAVASVLLGLIAQFRVVTLLVPGVFAKRMPRTAVTVGWVIATACQVGFLMWNVQAFVNDGPLHIAAKLMRGSVMSASPATAAAELVVLSLAMSAVAALLASKTKLQQPLLLMLWVVFFVPGFEDLAIKFGRYGNVMDALGFWEGGVWLAACIPLAAAGLVLSGDTEEAAIRL